MIDGYTLEWLVLPLGGGRRETWTKLDVIRRMVSWITPIIKINWKKNLRKGKS